MWLKIGLALLGLKILAQPQNQGVNKMSKKIYYRTKDGREDYSFFNRRTKRR